MDPADGPRSGAGPARGPGEAHGALRSLGLRLTRASRRVPAGARRLLGGPHPSRRRAPPPGARPGEMVLLPDAPEPEIRVMRYGPARFEERRVEDPESLRALTGGEGTSWIDVVGFGSRERLESVGGILGIHPLALADVVNVPQRPKAELYGDRLLVVLQMARPTDAGAIDLEQVSLVLGPGWVATFQEHPGDVFDPVRTRIRSEHARIRQLGADFLAYALVDAVVDGYFAVVEGISLGIDELEEEVLEGPTPDTLARLHALRSALHTLHRVQWQQRDAVATLLRDDAMPVSDAVRIYLRDVHDHAFQTVDVMESQRDLTVGLMELYLSTVNQRLNEVMKTLTIVATIFIPLTFVTGVYGMNFDHMPELRWRWGYPAVWGAMAAIALGLVVWFRRRGWLERDAPEAERAGRRRPTAAARSLSASSPPASRSRSG